MQLLICSRAQSPTTRHPDNQQTITPSSSYTLSLALSLSLFSAKGTHPSASPDLRLNSWIWMRLRTSKPPNRFRSTGLPWWGPLLLARRYLLVRHRMGRGPLSVSLRGSPPSTFNLARCLNRSAVNRPQEPQALHRQERRTGHASLPKTNPASKGETTGSPSHTQASLRWHFGPKISKRNETWSSDISRRRETPTCT